MEKNAGKQRNRKHDFHKFQVIRSFLSAYLNRIYLLNLVNFRCENPQQYGYEKLFEYSKAGDKVVTLKTTAEAENYKNKNILIRLESYDREEGVLRLIGEKGKACFLIDFSKIIRAYGVPRAIMLSKLRIFLKFCIKYGVFYAFADFAENEFELRSARELMHLSMLLGLNAGQAKFAMVMLRHYL